MSVLQHIACSQHALTSLCDGTCAAFAPLFEWLLDASVVVVVALAVEAKVRRA